MTMLKFDIPEIPWELVDMSKQKTRKIWAMQDLNLEDPPILIDWRRPVPETQSRSCMGGFYKFPISTMINDPEADVRSQLASVREQIECLEAGEEAGTGSLNFPGFHMIHFGTGPLATAFGTEMIVREDEQPFFEPAVHTPEEVLALKKPNFYKDGICPAILERIDYYNEATEGKIPLNLSDTAGPWSMATQIWHYEDMLEAIHTAPEAVHYILDLVTDCIIEWTDIQISRMWHWSGKIAVIPWAWHPHGYYIGDDCMVSVSPKIWEEFFLPYNNRMAREFGGMCYHCCMNYDFQFPSIVKTEGFMGLDATPNYNSIDKIEVKLTGKGVWHRPIGNMSIAGEPREEGYENSLKYIRQLKGKVQMLLGVFGDDRQDAIDQAKRLLDTI